MPKTLLLADDSVVIQKLVGLSFANEDVELITTDNGDDALAKAREHKPDAILADVVMPGMSGYEVCEAVKSDPELQTTPVLLLTGTFEAFDETRAREVGSDGHITKPFEAQALVDRVGALFAAAAAAAPPTASTDSATSATEDTYDFFDDGVANLSTAAGTDITRTAAASKPSGTGAADDAPSDSAFDFGADPTRPDPLIDADLLGRPTDLDQGLADPGADETIVVSNDPLDDPLANPMAAVSSDTRDVAFGAAPLDSPANDDALTVTGYADDLDVLAEPASSMADETPVDDTFLAAPPASVPETHTTVIMSDGDSSSARIALGAEAASAAAVEPEETMLAEDLFEAGTDPMREAEPGSPWAAGPSQSASIVPNAAPDIAAPEDASNAAGTDADSGADLDADIGSMPASLGVGSIDASSDAFDFGDTSPTDTSGSAESESDSAFAPPLASNYDVSSSDLGDPFAVSPRPVADLDDDAPGSNEPSGMSISEGLLGSPMDLEPEGDQAEIVDAEPVEAAVAEAPSILDATDSMSPSSPAPSSLSTPTPTPAPDITPVMRDRIHETLERVAWEAFADLSETMVKQVLERVESIAWEVIPQMAEALIKEEIRRMKGDDED